MILTSIFDARNRIERVTAQSTLNGNDANRTYHLHPETIPKKACPVQYMEFGAPNTLEKVQIQAAACPQRMAAESDSMSNVAATGKKTTARDTGRMVSS